MIAETLTKRHAPAITSDRWHVVHAKFDPAAHGERRPFLRVISSEHDDRTKAVMAARSPLSRLRRKTAIMKISQRDQVFVRRPKFVSLVRAPHGKSGRS
jgi:hypothetical protein